MPVAFAHCWFQLATAADCTRVVAVTGASKVAFEYCHGNLNGHTYTHNGATPDSQIHTLIGNDCVAYGGLLNQAGYFGDGLQVAGTVTASTNVEATTIVSAGTFVQAGVSAGIVATNPGVQGDNPLTREINEVSTVGAPNDAVTAPAAVAGRRITIINNGANTLEIWPAVGDNLGAGLNTAVTLAAGTNVTYVAYNDTNWEAI